MALQRIMNRPRIFPIFNRQFFGEVLPDPRIREFDFYLPDTAEPGTTIESDVSIGSSSTHELVLIKIINLDTSEVIHEQVYEHVTIHNAYDIHCYYSFVMPEGSINLKCDIAYDDGAGYWTFTDSETKTITTGTGENHAPYVNFGQLLYPTPYEGEVGKSVGMEIQAGDPDADGFTWTIDFGDGDSEFHENEGLALIYHFYDEVGVYTVTLTVVDEHGLTGTPKETTATITKGANDPPSIELYGPYQALAGVELTTVAVFIYDPDDDEVDLTVKYDYGDGSPVGSTPNHTYMEAGEYTMKGTVTDPEGASATDTCKITVRDVNGNGNGGTGIYPYEIVIPVAKGVMLKSNEASTGISRDVKGIYIDTDKLAGDLGGAYLKYLITFKRGRDLNPVGPHVVEVIMDVNEQEAYSIHYEPGDSFDGVRHVDDLIDTKNVVHFGHTSTIGAWEEVEYNINLVLGFEQDPGWGGGLCPLPKLRPAILTNGEAPIFCGLWSTAKINVGFLNKRKPGPLLEAWNDINVGMKWDLKELLGLE